MGHYWTDAEYAELRELQAAGKTYSEMSKATGRSRSAVAGCLNRLGVRLPAEVRIARNKTPNQARANKSKPAGRKPRFVERAVALEPDSGRRCGLVGLADDGCRYGIGDPRSPGFLFCGAAVEPGKPFCAYHCGMSYQPEKAKSLAWATRL